MKIIQKQIKKELSEEVMPKFDFTKSSLSAGEIDELITTLSLNIIKTREILKETFDEYIITLISFDKIKSKIKFLKTKNDESFNDCSPVFSKKFNIISNMEKNFISNSNNNINDNNQLEVNEDSNKFLSANSTAELYSNKLSHISQMTEKRSKLISNDAMQENSADGKSPNVNNANSILHTNRILNKEHNETFRENKYEVIKLSKRQDANEKEKIINCDLKKASNSDNNYDYCISENDEEFESFANKNPNSNNNNNKGFIINNKGGNRAAKREESYITENNNNENTDGDYYVSNDLDYYEQGHSNNDYFNNFKQERPNEPAQLNKSNFGGFSGKNENYDGNLDIDSLYLDSIQEEEFNYNETKQRSNPYYNKKQKPDTTNKNANNNNSKNANNYLKNFAANNSEIRKNLDKSEQEFKRNFPMKFYRHFQTESNNNNNNNNNHYLNTDNNSTYKRTRNHGNSSYLTHNALSQNHYFNNNKNNNHTDLGSKSKFDESNALLNFDPNNFSAISNDLIMHYPDLRSGVNRRNKNKSCDLASEKSKFLNNCEDDENNFSAYLDNTCANINVNNTNDKSVYSNLNAPHDNNLDKIKINEKRLRIDNHQIANEKSNFVSPYKKRETKAPILNTGNKIRKMSYFDLQTQQSLITNQTNQNQNSQCDFEENDNEENFAAGSRKSDLNNACIYSSESNSILTNGNKNKKSFYNAKNENLKQRENKNKSTDSNNFNSNILDKSTRETFKAKVKRVAENNSHHNPNNNNNELLDSKKTLHLDISRNTNLQNFQNSKALINESSFYLQTNNSNRHLNSSKAVNPENSHIDIIKSSSDKSNKATLQQNKNRIQDSIVKNNSDLKEDNSIYSQNSYALTEKTQNANKKFSTKHSQNPAFNLDDNNTTNRSFVDKHAYANNNNNFEAENYNSSMYSVSKKSEALRQQKKKFLGQEDNYMKNTNNNDNNRSRQQKSDLNFSNKYAHNCLPTDYSYENQENMSPNH